MRRCLIFALLVCGTLASIVASGASAETSAGVRATLPLEGYFRAGRFMPVMLRAVVNHAGATLHAPGAIPTRIELDKPGTVVAPLLLLSPRATHLTCSSDSGDSVLDLIALAETDVLLAVAADSDHAKAAAKELFPGRRIITIRLSVDVLALMTPIDFDSVDALAVDWQTDDRRIPPLLARGVTVIGRDWTQRVDIAGPTQALANVDAYSPTLAWKIGASKRVRRMAILCSVLLSIALLASVSLLSARRAMIVGVCVVIAAGAGLEIWRRAVSPLWRAGGQIVVTGADGAAQIDDWTYLAARSEFRGKIDLFETSRPIFVSTDQVAALEASLHVDAAGARSLHYRLGPREKLAVLSRRISRLGAGDAANRSEERPRSPMRSLAMSTYASREVEIVSEGDVEWTDDQSVRWASVICRRVDQSKR